MQRLQQPARIKADGCGNVQKFQHVKPPVAKLVFCDIGRRPFKPLGNGRLREPGRLAPGFEQSAQLLVTISVDGLGQSGSLPAEVSRSNSLWRILPKWEKIVS